MDTSSPSQATYSSSLKRSSSRTISFRVRAWAPLSPAQRRASPGCQPALQRRASVRCQEGAVGGEGPWIFMGGPEQRKLIQ